MIKSPLALFQMQAERLFVDAFQSMQPHFGEAPERFDAVDVRTATNEFTLAMMHPEMLFISDIHKTVIPSPAITVDDASCIYSSSNNGL